jgi:hypothetical protein
VSAGLAAEPLFDSVAQLREHGFAGFRSVATLRDSRCLEVPVERGVYIVVRDYDGAPEFLARSVAPPFRGQDPTLPLEALNEKWVPGARVLYVGRASGPGVRSLLQQRIKRYIRFGQGRVVAHWGGRLIWQLRDHRSLLFAWLLTPDQDPAAVEARLQAGFVERYGALPFANLKQENDA